MMGPRSMGAGTHNQESYGEAGGPSRRRTYDHDHDRIRELEREREPKVALTPAQRLIERYERMSTPPLPSPTTPGTVGCTGAGTRQTILRGAKSTRSRQYVYDYRGTASSSVGVEDVDDDSNGNGSGSGSGKRGGGGGGGGGPGNLKKDRSPIRQSLKNLFSVLKKGAGGLSKLAHHHHHAHGANANTKGVEESNINTNGLVVPGQISSSSKANEKSEQTVRDARHDHRQGQASASMQPRRKKMTGPLLYLSRQAPLCNADVSSEEEEEEGGQDVPAPASSHSCVRPPPPRSESDSWAWSTCSVTLEENKLVVSCFTGDLELYVREISLVRCVDIRSLSAAQLEGAVKEEGISLEDKAREREREKEKEKEMKVFEMSFSDGRAKERFAAKSVRERAGWISAIWDAILPNKDVDEQLKAQEHNIVDSRTTRRLPAIESPTPTPLPKMSSLLTGHSHSRYSSSPPPPPPAVLAKSPNTSAFTVLETHNGTTGPGTAYANGEAFVKSNSNLPLLPTVAPLSLHKKHPDLHLDLSEFAGPMSPPSPSIYPPTEAGGVGRTPGAASGSQSDHVVISPSIYTITQTQSQHQQHPPQTQRASSSAYSRPTSIFVASPISCRSSGSALSRGGGGGGGGGSTTANISTSGPPTPTTAAPNSPSIRNLSQLSVVRQRLAQIQRNHSELSAGESRRRYSYAASASSPAASPISAKHLRARATVVGTPTHLVFERERERERESPISPVGRPGSGWSKSEAVFYGGKSKGKGKGKGRPGDEKRFGSRRDESDEEPEPDGEKYTNTCRTNSRPRANSHREHDGPAAPSSNTHAGPSSKEDLRKLSKEINGIRNVLGGESGCSTVHEMVFNLEERMRGEKKDLRAIKDELKVLGDRISEAIATNVDVAARIEAVNKNAPAAVAVSSANAAASNGVARGPSRSGTSAGTPPPTTTTNEASRKESDDPAIIQALKEVKDRLSIEFPALAVKLQDIKDAQQLQQEKEREREKEDKIVTMNNIARSSSSSGDNSRAAAEHKLLFDKLEEIRSMCQAPAPAPPNSLSAPVANAEKDGNPDLKERLDNILKLIQEDSNKQTLLSQQQADSVRYLNELNSWLEAFVNNGTSQIQGISNNIERLCNEIGCTPNNGNNSNGRPSNKSPPNLVNDIRQLVAGMKARDQNFAALQAAVHSLLEVLSASQAQHGADSQAIAGLMDRQRHDQEAMFRAFTNEISGEIKGERLRFVDAMKEATAINVQLHVEQFKQELSREVMAMTEEVGRLHREKQIVENQISDLFSFYSKHKKAEMPLQVIPPNTGMPLRNNYQVGDIVQEVPRANIPRSNRQRTLPAYPRQQ